MKLVKILLTLLFVTVSFFKAPIIAANSDTTGLYAFGVKVSDLADADSALFFSELAKYREIGEKLNADSLKGKSFLMQGEYYKKRGNTQAAIESFNKALDFFNSSRKTTLIAKAYNNLGVTMLDVGKYEPALKNLFNALRRFEQAKDVYNEARVVLNIGLVFYYQKNYDLALFYYNKSLKLRESIKDIKGMALAYNNIGIVYYFKGRTGAAMEYFKKALAIYEKNNMIRAMSMPLFNIGEIHYETGQYDSALVYYQKSYRIDSMLDDKASLTKSLTKMAGIYNKHSRREEAARYANQALELAKLVDSKEDIRDCYLVLSDIYSDKGLYKEAWKCSEKASLYKDSLYNSQSAEKIAEMQTLYETEKKDLMLKSQHDKIEHQKLITRILAAGLCIVLALLILVFIEYYQKKKAYIILNIQKKQITDSINYASRIQAAILPHEEVLNTYLPEYFIYFSPKDIVSGDFYWVSVHDGRTVIAVADCTGHGVPGAFMSMLGFAYLNEIVSKNKDIEAKDILNQLRIKVKTLLNQDDKTGAKDGMDIALVIINRNKTKIQYSGANNPLLVVRDGKINSLLPDKMPIGIYPTEKESFSQQEFELQEGDMMYMFSDGYADQFGGERSKKLGREGFYQLLLEASVMPVKAQRYFLEEKFLQWSLNLEQMDDVLVLGMKV
ncbi:MAG TPA: tetratricopeptide repeat protein [Bacteroidales bacterium]|nr:tetratricopeptide repeat protein [Bacteroidales bacterium]